MKVLSALIATVVVSFGLAMLYPTAPPALGSTPSMVRNGSAQFAVSQHDLSAAGVTKNNFSPIPGKKLSILIMPRAHGKSNIIKTGGCSIECDDGATRELDCEPGKSCVCYGGTGSSCYCTACG